MELFRFCSGFFVGILTVIGITAAGCWMFNNQGPFPWIIGALAYPVAMFLTIKVIGDD